MLSFFISISLNVVLTVFCMMKTYRRREKLTCMAGMMIAMTLGMISSAAFGLSLAIQLHDLSTSTIVATLYGVVVGYWTGKPVSLMASLDGVMAGIMGGMMGAMVGDMLSGTTLMILFFEIIFIFVIMVLNQMINEETGAKPSLNRLGQDSFFTLVIGIAVIAILFSIGSHQKSEVPQQSVIHNHK